MSTPARPPAPPASLARLEAATWLLLFGASVAPFVLAMPARYRLLAALASVPAGWTAAGLQAALAQVRLGTRQWAAYALAWEAALALGFWLAAAQVARHSLRGGRPATLSVGAGLVLLLAPLAWLPVLPADPQATLASAWLRPLSLLPLAGVLFSFPESGALSGWRRALLASYAVGQLAALGVPALGLPLNLAAVSPMAVAWNLGWLGGAAATMLARGRRASLVQRQQIKWLMLGAAVPAVAVPALLAPLWLLPVARPSGPLALLYTLAALPAITLAALAWPAGLSLAVRAHRPWQADLAINRALVLAPVLAVLGALLGLSLLALTSALPQERVMTFAVAAALAGLLFLPLNRGVQGVVDRWFFGLRVDYRSRAADLTERGPALRDLGPYKHLAPVAFAAGTAYRAQQPGSGRPVVVRALAPHVTAAPGFRQRFASEMALVCGLEHPNLARVYDAGEAEGRLYVASEYAIGQDLASFLLINGRLPLERGLPILEELAAGLDYLHARGLAHGDVRVANIMLALREPDALPRQMRLTEDERFPARAAFLPMEVFRTLLLNVGLARLLRTGRRAEALGYTAPELLRGADPDARSDIYALGALAHLMFVGSLPFRLLQPTALALAHLRQPLPDPRARVSNLPRAMAAALQRALAKDPDERFALASDFVRAIRG